MKEGIKERKIHIKYTSDVGCKSNPHISHGCVVLGDNTCPGKLDSPQNQTPYLSQTEQGFRHNKSLF